jgi:RIO kinase 1
MVKKSGDRFKVHEGVFDDFTLDTLDYLRRKKYFDELGRPIKTGKEGDVYFAYKDDEIIAIKIYRLTTANFKKISSYILRDYRFKNIKGNLRKVILRWVQKEYRNLSLCHNAGMNVPYPYKQTNNVILMDYIDGYMLKDVVLDDPKGFFELLLEQMDLMKNRVGLIHGDLSEFNVMACDGVPYIIDLGQGMSFKTEEDFKYYYDLYERDVSKIVNYFNKKYSLGIDFEDVIRRLEAKE